MIVVATIGIVAAIAAPGFLRARMSGNEAVAISSLRAINSGQAAFSRSCAAGGYAATLDDLAKPPTGSSRGFVTGELGTNGATKSGYLVTLAPDGAPGTTAMSGVATCNSASAPLASSYFARADPLAPGGTGLRFFATDTRGGIFYDGATIANPITVTTVVE